MIKRAMMMLMVLTATLVAAGCGGSSGKDIASVKSCLKDLKLSVEEAPDTDNDVKEGVFATTDLTALAADGGKDAAKAPEEFTFAMAAHVKDASKVKDFQKESEEFAKTASSDGKLEFETGVDGTYVWVAGGAKGSAAFDDARGCVKP